MEEEIKIQEKVLSKKARKVQKFLNSFATDLAPDKKNNIIKYFNQETSGIPVFIKNSPAISSTQNFLKKTWSWLELKLLGYSWQELSYAWNCEKLRKNNDYFSEQAEYPFKIDKKATAILANLRNRNKVNLSLEVEIPVLKRDYYDNLESAVKSWAVSANKKITDNKLSPYILINNPLLYKQFLNSPFLLAHEYAHLERGSWSSCRNTLIAKLLLGISGFLLDYAYLPNKNSIPVESLFIGLGCLIMGNLFKKYFYQKEEKACDLRAIELTGSADGIKELFSLNPTLGAVAAGSDWTISELKVERLEKVKEHTWQEKLFTTHPSCAERLRYCQNYAEQLKNPGKYFLGYRIRK